MMICIINCDFDESDVTNGGSILNRLVNNSKVYNAFENSLPEDYNFSGFIISGSRASVYDEEDWIKKTLEYIKKIPENIPVLGICFGFQAICLINGGKVESSGKFEEGFKNINIEMTSNLFQNINKNIFYESHGDVAKSLPVNAEIIAKNEFSVQAYKLNNNYCVQFHPEITRKTATIMAKRDEKDINEIISTADDDYGLILIDNFINICNNN